MTSTTHPWEDPEGSARTGNDHPDASSHPIVSIIPVPGLPEVRAGDELAALLAPCLREAGITSGDVVCVSTKIVSKALGLTVPPEERDAAIRAAAVRTVARRLHTRVVTSVVQIPSGPVMAAAGVDSSNAPEGPLLLPEDPDDCAAQLHAALTTELGIELGVLLTDTSSRVWRLGVGDITLGAAGVASLQDLRGGTDDTGRSLSVTVRNLADELAAAADLVKGKSSRIPVAIVRGVDGALVSPAVPARELSRTGTDDWFRRPSLESVWVALGIPEEREPVARMSPEPPAERVARAVAIALQPRAGHAKAPGHPWAGASAEIVGPDRIVVTAGGQDRAHWVGAGRLLERIRTALDAESIAQPLPPVRVELADAPTALRKDPS